MELSIKEWLQKIVQQLNLYLEEIEEQHTDLSPLPPYFSKKIEIETAPRNLKKRLQELSILYMDRDTIRADKIVSFLKKITKNVQHSTEEDTQNSVFNLQPFDIILINLNKENYQVIDFAKSSYPHISLIPIFEKISDTVHHKMIKQGIIHCLKNPLNSTILYNELLSIVKREHIDNSCNIKHKEIEKFIQTLKPLSRTIIKTSEVCDDKESSIKQLTSVVNADPILSANILKLANSPIYNSLQIETLDKAVAKFGKKTIKTLTIAGISKSLGSIDLSPYNIDESTFSKVAVLRLNLMMKWYAPISKKDFSILSSTAIVSNIGQILIAKELIKSDKVALFQELQEVFPLSFCEKFILNTTTSYISSEILKHLQLSREIVSIIEHSDNPLDAPSQIRKLSVINHIVNTLIDTQGNIAKAIPSSIIALMKIFELNVGELERAIPPQ